MNPDYEERDSVIHVFVNQTRYVRFEDELFSDRLLPPAQTPIIAYLCCGKARIYR